MPGLSAYELPAFTSRVARQCLLTVVQSFVSCALTLSQFARSGVVSGILTQLMQATEDVQRTRAAIADAAGIDRGQFTRFMKGDTRLSIESAERLADVLGYDIILKPRETTSAASEYTENV